MKAQLNQGQDTRFNLTVLFLLLVANNWGWKEPRHLPPGDPRPGGGGRDAPSSLSRVFFCLSAVFLPISSSFHVGGRRALALFFL